MQIVHTPCAGLDVHKKTIVVCVRIAQADGTITRHIRTFGTTTAELLNLVAWLVSLEVTHVAMESTGEFWKPLYNLLEGSFTILVVNAAHIKHVPGRKTDGKDAEWIAALLAHGLLRPSFVRPPPQRALRDLTSASARRLRAPARHRRPLGRVEQPRRRCSRRRRHPLARGPHRQLWMPFTAAAV